MASDDDDFVFYGTPIEREEDITTRKKKAVAEASGQLRTSLVPWKQEVTDEEGRRRFHGAFTGGFSAGYYNTVGSKEGWTPQSFTSSRKNRAEVKQQSIYNFLDEDEKSELEGGALGTSVQFDTFGFTAAELARKQAEKEQHERPSAIPGPVPDELIVPSTESIGVKLLLKMGWRQGRSIKNSNKNALQDARREARKAFLAFSSQQVAESQLDEEDVINGPDLPVDNEDQFSKSTPAFVLNPKQDLYGLGYDPFKHAPEFRENKRQRLSGHNSMESARSLSMKAKVGPGFGIGALEDLDAEDEDIYAPEYNFHAYVQDVEEPPGGKPDTLRILDSKKNDILSGFKAASKSDSQFERFDPPRIPEDFVPHHKFPAPLENNGNRSEIPPPKVPPPEDNNLKVLIEGVAALVARCGKLFEDLSREKNQSNPLFSFLSGGNGCDFYARKLWEERQKHSARMKPWDAKIPENTEKLTAERRGNILGERALERSTKDSGSLDASAATVNLQIKLTDTFTKPVSISHLDKPFSDDPAKQERYEQFLKEKYEGGLRSKDSGGASYMSETARARERLEFEAAVEASQKGNSDKESKASNQLLAELSGAAALQFTTGGVESNSIQPDEKLITKAMYPRREEFQWRPAPILCKRFDLIDPYMGKPPPAPRIKSKMDTLLFMPNMETAKVDEHAATKQASSSVAQTYNGKQHSETSEKEVEAEIEVENVKRPVDLYKAIFSDDSEDEGNIPNQVDDTQKKIEVANTTLNRLIAGDFLESLGKELGLEVPKETATRNAPNINVEKEGGSKDSLFAQKKRSSSPNAIIGIENNSDDPASNEERSNKNGSFDGGISKVGGKIRDGVKETKLVEEERNLETQRARDYNQSDCKPRHERKKRHLDRRHKSRSSSSDSDESHESDDYRDRHRSSSKRREKRSSRENSSSKRHRSKHHKHRRKDSPHRSHRSSGKEYEDRKRKNHKYDD